MSSDNTHDHCFTRKHIITFWFPKSVPSSDTTILVSIQSPILYEATAAKARVAYAAACVGDSDGNQATGLQMEASMLINMSCECMETAMVQARDKIKFEHKFDTFVFS